MPLFHISPDNETLRIRPNHFQYERNLQELVEANLPEIFGVHFLSSEFVLRGEHSGRIDTLGIDFEGAPTIIEYKRSESDSVVNQGVYYMDWILEHRGDFTIAAQSVLGPDVQVSWSNPRLIIIAERFAPWDTSLLKHVKVSVELWSYTRYGEDLIHFELVYGQQRDFSTEIHGEEVADTVYTIEGHLDGKPERVQELFDAIREGIMSWQTEDGGIIETPNKLYISYRFGRNFTEIETQNKGLKIHIDIPFDQINDPQRVTRDVSDVGHWGTGDVELKVTDMSEIEYALSLIKQAYHLTL